MIQKRDIQSMPLTDREDEIAQAYANGDSYHRISERLFIAPSTVRTHLAKIYRKLGVSSKLELHMVLHGQQSDNEVHSGETAVLISELALSLEDSIARERALGEVLRIISRSNGEITEVIAAVLGHALELCDAQFGLLLEYNPKTGSKATYSRGIPQAFDDWFAQQGEFQASPYTGLGRVIVTREVVNIADVCAEEIYRRGDPLRDATVDLGGARSFAAIPMLAGDR